MKSFQIIASGKVQGVFFRDSTKRKADELGLTGFVRNLEDGTVEVVAQGDKDNLNKLMAFIRNNPGHSNVNEVKINHKELEKLEGFEIWD